MNKKKKNRLIILFILLLAAAGAFAALRLHKENLPKEEGDGEESHSVVSIDKSQITDIGIIGSEGNVNLVKEGDDWKCAEDEGTAIDKSLVENFLANATEITASTRIENAEDLSEYGLDNPVINLTLRWDDNMYTIKVGDYNSIISGYYLNVNDEADVYVVDSSVYYSLNKSIEDFKLTETEDLAEEEN